MGLVDNAWYANYGDGSSTGYYAVPQWATATVYAAGQTVRQLAAPTAFNERIFVCVVAGTSHATTEPTWTVTRGAKTTDNTVTWQECTGIAALNGNAAATPSWTISTTPPGGVKNTAVTLGQVIKRDNGASYQICTVAGTAGNSAEPSFSNTAGVTTADNTVTWTSLGVVGDWTAWRTPHARVKNAMTTNWAKAGNNVYVGDNSAGTIAAAGNDWGNLGTINSLVNVLCVDHTVAVPTSSDLKTTGIDNTTGANNRSIDGALYIYGMNLSYAQNFSYTAQGASLVMENCVVTNLSNTSLGFGSFSTDMTFKNTNFVMNGGSTEVFKNPNCCTLRWWGGVLSGSNLPTYFITPANGGGVSPWIEGVDLSVLGSGKTLVNNPNQQAGVVIFKDCKLGASVAVCTDPVSRTAGVDLINCDSGATNYRHERYRYGGSHVVDTTIVRTGGASNGVTTIAWKIVTLAGKTLWTEPFECIPITIWNDSTSAMTVTFYGTTTGGGVPNDDDIWVDVEYLGDAGSPQGTFLNGSKANILAASAAGHNSSDGSTWGGGGAGNGWKRVSDSFTPAQKGPITFYLKVAKASATYYVDPKPVVS